MILINKFTKITFQTMKLGRPKTSMYEKIELVIKLSDLLKLGLTINQSVDLYNKHNKNQRMAKCTVYSWYKADIGIKKLIDGYKVFFENHKKKVAKKST